MTVAVTGWIVLGALCVAALAVMLAGVLHLARAARGVKIKLARLEEVQRRTFDPQRLSAATARISRDAEAAKDLLERAAQAIATIGVAVRYAALVVRVAKLLT